MLNQPARGVLATLIVIAISIGFISLFSFPTFATWVSFLTISMIPMQIVIGVVWGGNPAFASSQKQPVKGVVLILCAAVVGALVALISFKTVGGGIGPPTPMLAMCMIVSVIITFWFAIMWGGWPFTAMIKNPIAAGMVLLVACYLVNYLLFRIFFNYDFMQGAPVYVPSLDPHGLFNAWSALVFYVTAIAVMFLMLCFDLWPLTSSPAIMKQPVLGIVWTIIALVVGEIAFYIGVNVLNMQPAAFMVKVPIPFIFGTIIVLNMLQGSLFAKYTQPMKGILNTLAVIVIGNGLAIMYSALAPMITGTVNPGPPGFDFEIWLASALLAVTFPFLIFYAEFFKMWPLKKAE